MDVTKILMGFGLRRLKKRIWRCLLLELPGLGGGFDWKSSGLEYCNCSGSGFGRNCE